jgi:HEPN domain-containing protein
VSSPIITRADFQQLAEDRLREALVLLNSREWHGAYYLVGYALELGLKACIIKKVMTTDAWLDPDFSKNCYTHNLDKLVKVADLDAARTADCTADTALASNWRTVSGWSEQKRYHRATETEARDMCSAVLEPTNGVLQWVKKYW